LYAHERRMVIPFVLLSTALFVGGSLFCYISVLPLSYSFFHEEFKSIGVTPTIRIGDQISMTITTVFGFGAVFELPLVTYFLARMGVVDHKLLLRFFRHAVVTIFLVAAIITPPDVFTQFLMAVPLTALYAISIGIAYLVAPRSSTSELSASPPDATERLPTRV
ncbi:MAG: twin arginine translocation system, TatC protein, partial [Pseudomonadota bacterium]